MAGQQPQDKSVDEHAGTTSGSVSGGVAGIGQLPAFELPAAGGGQVRSWDYKSRRHLVLWLAGATPDPRALTEAAAREREMQDEGAVLLVIVRGSPEQAEQLRSAVGLRGPLLADGDGRVHARLAAGQPLLVVADRNGTIYWRTPVAGGQPDLDEALSWLRYLNILEPECGTCVPAWPVE
jgi:peroxiredoxin